MTETPRETRVLEAVVTLVDSLLADFDVVELLTDLTGHCTQLLDVAAAGLLLGGPGRDLHLMAATPEDARHLDLFQLQALDGPCRDCYAGGRAISVADLSAAPARWPRFTAAAADAGFASVHAVPMRAAGTVLGALGLFGTRPGDLSDADLLVAHTLAHVACVALLQDRPLTPVTVHPPLQAALASRTVVEQAKGFLRESLDVSIEEAHARLRDYAHRQHSRLTEVARALITQPDQRPAILAALTGPRSQN